MNVETTVDDFACYGTYSLDVPVANLMAPADSTSHSTLAIIIGASVGGVVFCAAVIGGILFALRKQKTGKGPVFKNANEDVGDSSVNPSVSNATYDDAMLAY